MRKGEEVKRREGGKGRREERRHLSGGRKMEDPEGGMNCALQCKSHLACFCPLGGLSHHRRLSHHLHPP